MTAYLLFCTSTNVTPELVREIQKGDENEPFVNAFAPARHVASEQTEPSKTEVDVTIEPFVDATDAKLHKLFDERAKATNYESFYETSAVLDERSTQDHTMAIHSLCPDLRSYDDETLPTETHWEAWRVHISECYHMVVQLEHNCEIEDWLYLRRKSQLTDQDGVFEHKRAIEWYLAGGDEEPSLPQAKLAWYSETS